MLSVNKVILVGRLGANPELRYTPDGKAICTMSVATNRVFLDKEKNKQEKVIWHRVVAWGKQGEICKEHLAKGRQVYVEGRLENHSYSDKAGARHFSSEIVSNTVVFLDSRSVSGRDEDLRSMHHDVADLAPRASQSLDGSSNFAHAGDEGLF